MPYIETNVGIFVDVMQQEYIDRLKEKAITLLTEGPNYNYDFPKFNEQSPYKIHVTLKKDDYFNHQNNVRKIIIDYLEKGVICNFKFTNSEVIQENISRNEKFLKILAEHKIMLFENKKPADPEWINEYLLKINDFFEEKQSQLPNKYELAIIIAKVESRLESERRFLNGDQFTIYIPENFNKDEVFLLCKEVDTYLTRNKANPGISNDVESPLGTYINFRQEFLLQDFDEMNEDEFYNYEKRIDTTPKDTNDIEEISRRKAVVKEQQESDLYKYLSNSLTNTSSRTLSSSPNGSSFFKPAQEPQKDDGIDKTKTSNPPRNII